MRAYAAQDTAYLERWLLTSPLTPTSGSPKPRLDVVARLRQASHGYSARPPGPMLLLSGKVIPEDLKVFLG